MIQQILQWKRQNRYSNKKNEGHIVENCCKKNLMIFFVQERMKTREDKRMVKLEFIFFKITLFGHITKKTSHSFLWCMVIPLGPHLLRLVAY